MLNVTPAWQAADAGAAPNIGTAIPLATRAAAARPAEPVARDIGCAPHVG
jgi:hypothetical protein